MTRFWILDPAGHVGLEDIYKEMREEDTGLRPETFDSCRNSL